MGLLDDIVKAAIPVAAGAFLGPAAGGLGGIFSNPAISGAMDRDWETLSLLSIINKR